jgi:hypothetical protein
MPRAKYYWNTRANAMLTPKQRLASKERLKEQRRLRRNAVLRATRVPNPRVKLTHCLRGHERTPENVQKNGTCRLCGNARKNPSKAKPPITLVCAWCGREFTTSRPKFSTYCKKQCKSHAHRKRKKLGLPKGSSVTRGHRGRKRVSVEHKRKMATEKKRRWRLKYPEKAQARNSANSHRRRAKEKSNGGSWTATEWLALKTQYGNKCLGCNRTEALLLSLGLKLVPDHVKPIALGGVNSIENLQPLCHGKSCCNNRKGAQEIDYRLSFARNP